MEEQLTSMDQHKDEVTVKSKVAPPMKYRSFMTAALLFAFLNTGLSESALGPTLVSMEILLNTDTKSISTVFTGGAVGHLVGTVICGLIYAKVNKQLIFTVSLCGIALALAGAPFSPSLIVFIAINFVQFFFKGLMDTTGNSYLLKMWERSPHRQPLTQALHCLFSIGCTIGPFIVREFLVDLHPYLNTHNQTITDNITELIQLNVTNNTGHEEDMRRDIEFVRFAYVTLAVVVFLTSSLFLVAFILMGPSCRENISRKSDTKTADLSYKETHPSRKFLIQFMIIMFTYFFMCVWIERTFGALVAVFVVKGLDWSNDSGALITAIYWGCHGTGRVVGIFLSSVMSPRNMIIMDCALILIGYGLFFLVNLHPIVSWVTAGVVGFGISTLFPTGMLLAETYIEITGRVAAVILSAASISSMTGPALAGFLMDEVSYMCFVYLLFASVIMFVIVFSLALVYVKLTGVKRHKLTENMQVEMVELNNTSIIEQSDHISNDMENVSAEDEIIK